MTFTLDLAALPRPDGPVNVLDDIACGQLAIAVDDDTGTDFIRVELVTDTGTAVHAVSWGTLRARFR